MSECTSKYKYSTFSFLSSCFAFCRDMMLFKGIVFLFSCLVSFIGLVTSENEMDIKLPENLKFEINKYVSDIVGQLTEKYENKISSLEQRVAVLESRERQFLREYQNGPSKTGNNPDGQNETNIDEGGVVVSKNQQDGAALGVGNNQVGQKATDIQTDEAIVADESVKSSNFTRRNTHTQHTFKENKSSLRQLVAPKFVQSAQLLRDSRVAGPKVAFLATLTNALTNMGEKQEIVFDYVVTNIGNGYNNRHGIFVAPVFGVYVFVVTLEQYGDPTWAYFMVNGNPVASIDVHYQSSQTIVINLQQGGDVYVQNEILGGNIAGVKYSSFSGFLLYQ